MTTMWWISIVLMWLAAVANILGAAVNYKRLQELDKMKMEWLKANKSPVVFQCPEIHK